METVGPRQRGLLERVVTGEEAVFRSLAGAFSFGRAAEWIVCEFFGVAMQGADRTVTPVLQDHSSASERDRNRGRPQPEGDDPEFAGRGRALMRAGTDIGHDPVKVQGVVLSPRMRATRSRYHAFVDQWNYASG